jgi:hypothetical protein
LSSYRFRQPRPTGSIVIRTSRPDDQRALERLAELDERLLPSGAFLLAEVDGRLVAAAPLDVSEEPLADPFLPTAELCELLRLRARQLRQRDAVRALRTLPKAA